MSRFRNWIRQLFGRPVHNPYGAWVAEVWLEWEICRGSTLYRERFCRKEDAARMAESHARTLDAWLPQREDVGIAWGVRKACNADTGHAIWSPCMPGSRGYCGEHREAHPLQRS